MQTYDVDTYTVMDRGRRLAQSNALRVPQPASAPHFSRVTNHMLFFSLLLCVTLRWIRAARPSLGRDDRSHRVPRGTRGGLRTDGHAGHQKSTQVSKQSPTGESSPDITCLTTDISFASNRSLFSLSFLRLPSLHSTPPLHLVTPHD